jgi:hypothetical protein
MLFNNLLLCCFNNLSKQIRNTFTVDSRTATDLILTDEFADLRCAETRLVMLFNGLLLWFPFTRVACTLALSPICDTLIEGFNHFVTSMTAPIAPAATAAG